jgi:hypothetical protein
MNGVTIIEEHICRVVEFVELVGFGIFVTLLAAAALYFYWWVYNHTESNKMLPVICAVLLVVICIVFWIVQINRYNVTYKEYTVTVDDSVSLNEFLERYEIVSVDGDEYRVKEIYNGN